MKTIHLKISGKVQGVFFRACAKDQALMLGIKGWIKNKSNGDVEALVTGEDISVQNFINWCKHGPENAMVSEIVTTHLAPQAFKDFKIIR